MIIRLLVSFLLVVNLESMNAFVQDRLYHRINRRSSISSLASSKEMFSLKKGSSVAIVTPLNPDGSINLDAMRTLLRYHVDNNTDNLCLLGTTGEATTMSMSERESIIKVAVEEVKGKIPILVGTGTINPNHVKEQTLQAIDLGCDAALVVTPYYVKPPQRGLIGHFTSIADLGIPIILYNVPGRTGIDLTPESVGICSEHENIVGIKEATGQLDRVQQLRDILKDENFLLYSGDDSTTNEFVLLGGDGCISVTANLAPGAMHDMMLAALNGNKKEADEINEKLKKLHENLFIESNPIPTKWALKKLGLIPSAFCRPPMSELDSKFYPVVENAMKEALLI